MRSRTIMFVFVGVLAVAALALAGCDQIVGNAVKGAVEKGTGVSVDEQKGEVTVQGKDGQSVTVGGQEGKVPEGFPAEFPQYTGATVKTGAKAAGATGGVYTVTWTTADSVDAVMSFYKDKLKAANYEIESEAQGSGQDGTGGAITFKSATQQGVVTVSSESGETKIAAVITIK